MKKLWMLMLLLARAAAVLAGCASNADTLASPSPAVSAMPSASPDATNSPTSPQPDASGNPGSVMPGMGGITSLEDAQKKSEEMEDAIGKLSEVDDAYVVAIDTRALVGVKYNSQYQGQTDDRMKKMILARIQTVDKAVTGVAVSSEEDQVKKIQSLAENLDSATSLSAISSQAEDLMNQITVFTE